MAEPKTFSDQVLDRVIPFARDVVAGVVKMYPQPPGRVKLSEREQLERYMRLRPEDVQRMVQERGQAAVENYLYRMNQLRQKYGAV